MADDMDFANTTGRELLQLLARRVEEGLSPQSDSERFQAMLGPALIVVAEVLRESVENAKDSSQAAHKLVDFSGRWLLKLLGQ
jgi:hypothetical protein